MLDLFFQHAFDASFLILTVGSEMVVERLAADRASDWAAKRGALETSRCRG